MTAQLTIQRESYSLYTEYNLPMCDQIRELHYNGIPINVYGDKKNWGATKTFSYYKEVGGELEIIGTNIQHDWHELRMGCEWAGLLLECDDGLISNANDWKAFGSNGEEPLSKSDYSEPCVSISPFGTEFFRTYSDAQKIWPRNGENFAWFSIIPEPSGKYSSFLYYNIECN